MPNLRVVHELVNDERVGNQRRLRKACRCGSSAVSLFIHMAWDCEQVCYGRMTLRKAKRGKEGICILLYQEGSCKRKTQLIISQFLLLIQQLQMQQWQMMPLCSFLSSFFV